MAVGSVLVALQASAAAGRGTRPEDFVLPLQILDGDGVASARAVEGGSSIVEFSAVRLRDFQHDDEPSAAMFRYLDQAFELAAGFLNRRAPELFAAFRASGLQVRLFVDVWMDQDQMELTFPPHLIAACARQGIGIFLISNDIPAAEAVRMGAG
jgi:hypothetical protein